MASLCLPNSELHVGVRWDGSAPLTRALAEPERTVALLYPGEGALDVLRDPPPRPVTLVVVDGTWWQTKKVVRDNPALSALPRYAFTPPAPSEYRIRKEPRPDCVSTIEALVHVLGALEGDPGRFRALLAPFRAMIDAQLDCEARYQGARGRSTKRRRRGPAPSPIARAFRERAGDLVCVAGEANAWPYGSPERARFGDEIVHWVAHRLGTDETFEMVLAPRHPMSAGTEGHVGLGPGALVAGGGMGDFLDAWGAFVRDTDVLCAWGPYIPSLLAAAGARVPKESLDLRAASRSFARGSVGSPGNFAAHLGVPVPAPAGPGRARLRLAQVVAVARHFRGDA